MSKETTSYARPWDILHQEIEKGDLVGVEDALENLTPSQTARTLSRLSAKDQSQLLTMLPATLGDLSKGAEEDILEELSSQDAAEARELLSYPEESAGGVMAKEVLGYQDHWTVGDVLADLREFSEKYADYDVQYTYVVDGDDRLLGVVRLRDLVLAPSHQPITELMIADPISVHAEDTLEVLGDCFEQHHYIGIPVVDEKHRLIGAVHRNAVLEEENRQSEEAYLESAGIVGGEELRTIGFFRRSSHRLS